jgi:hypothetical protein
MEGRQRSFTDDDKRQAIWSHGRSVGPVAKDACAIPCRGGG